MEDQNCDNLKNNVLWKEFRSAVFFAEQRSADCSMQNEEGNEGNKAKDRQIKQRPNMRNKQ